MSRAARIAGLLPLAALALASALADPPADCTDFKWDLGRELAIFRASPSPVVAAADPRATPHLAVGQLYDLTLLPQATVTFAHPPGGRRAVEVPHAGLVEFSLQAAGHYRVTADGHVWLDVVAADRVVDSSNFSGSPRCTLIRKSVDFDLPASTRLVLQLSQSPVEHVRLAITPAADAQAATPR